jgi:hypothetical protein
MGLLENFFNLFKKEQPKKIKENYIGGGFGSFFLPPEIYADNISQVYNLYSGSVGIAPLSSARDRAMGYNYPFLRSLADLLAYRANSRWAAQTNAYATGLINGLTSYVIGDGFSVKISSDTDNDFADFVQDLLNIWMDNINFLNIQSETYVRSEVDGEVFIRYFMTKEGLRLGWIEPEWVQPISEAETNDEPWNWSGIYTDPNNINDIKGYGVLDWKLDGTIDRIYLPSDKVEFLKCNSTGNTLRGLPSICFDTLESLTLAATLASNIASNCAAGAAITLIRQHETATATDIDAFLQSQIPQNIPYQNVAYNAPQAFKGFQGVTGAGVYDIPKTMQYVDPPSAGNIDKYISALDAILQKAGRRWNAPTWIMSGHTAQHNYASSLTAESPFLRCCQRKQHELKRHFMNIITKALDNFAIIGDLPLDWRNNITINISPPSTVVRDVKNEIEVNKALNEMGIKSKRSIAAEFGLDYDAEQDLLQKEKDLNQNGIDDALEDEAQADEKNDSEVKQD